MTEFFKNKLPFKVVSSSVNSGYVTQISSGYKPGIEIVNLHRDTYGELEGTPAQSPFTSEHVGGYQFRHVPFNTGSDNDYNRPEYFKINPTASSLRVYGPDFEDVNKPRGQTWRGAKSPVNIKNIKSTDRTNGNYEKNYQVIQTSGRGISNNLFVDGFVASGNLTTQFLYSNKTIEPATASTGNILYTIYFTAKIIKNNQLVDSGYGIKLSFVYGQPTTNIIESGKNITINSSKTGIGIGQVESVSQLVAIINNAGNWVSGVPKFTATFVGLSSATVSAFSSLLFTGGSIFYDYSLPDIVRIDSNNQEYKNKTVFVERFNAPGGKEESSRGTLDRIGEEFSPNNSLLSRNIKVRQPFYRKLSQHSAQFNSGSTYNLLPATGSIDTVTIHAVNRNENKRYVFSGDTIQTGNRYDNFWVQHAVPTSEYSYAWVTASAVSKEYDSLLSGGQIQFNFTSSLLGNVPINLETQTILGSLSGTQQFYSSWRQTQTNLHPVARKLRESNIIAIQNPRNINIQENGNQNFLGKNLTSTNFKETPITSKYFPLEQEIVFTSDENNEQPIKLKYTNRNSTAHFANDLLNERLNFESSGNLSNSDFYQYIVQALQYTFNSPIKEIVSLKFKENVYPKALNTFLSGTRSRTEYILDQPGFDRDGYDRQLGTQRVFWRDNQEDRRRSPNSSGGHINSLGYSSLEESGSDFTQNENGILFDNNFINHSASLTQNFTNLDRGINNSIIPLETSSSERELYTYTGSFRGTFYNNGNIAFKAVADIVKRGHTNDIAGEFNNSFVDFYEQFLKDNQKQSIGAIYRNTSYKQMLNSLPKAREDLLDKITHTDDESVFVNPKPRYVAFVGGGELNTGSVFDNSSNFSNEYFNTFIYGANSAINFILPVGNKIYFGGDFTSIGGIAADRIAVYDKTTQNFSPVGTSSFNGSVHALAVSGTDIYAGGSFTSPAKNIAKYDTLTNTWSSLGNGLSLVAFGFGAVYAIAVSGTDIYAGGAFDTTGSYVSRWSTLPGGNWTTLSGGLNSTVNTLVVSGTDIYAGGDFTTTGSHVARWSTLPGGNWSALSGGLGGGTNVRVECLAVSGTDIYAGGVFTTTGSNVARWSTLPGGNWSALSGGLGDNFTGVFTLAVSGTDIYAGGDFTTTGSNVARWSTLPGGNWSALSGGLGGGTNVRVECLAVSGTDIYAGGRFTTTGSNISQWSALPDGNWSLFNTIPQYNIFSKSILNNSLNLNDVKFSTLDNGLINQKIKTPTHDSAEDYYKADIYQIAKNYSILPEFKISEHIKDYINNGANFQSVNNEFLSLDGVREKYKSADSKNSIFNKETFLEKYSFTDALNKQQIETDYEAELEQESISINVSAVKKLLPYNGFYPQERTIQLANLYNDYIDNVLSGGIYNLNNINDYYNDRILSGNYVGTITDFGDLNSSIDVERYGNKYYLIQNTARNISRSYLYSSSNSSYKNFSQNIIYSYDNHSGSRIISASNGLNIYSFSSSAGLNVCYNHLSTNGINWSTPAAVIQPHSASDGFGEYWDYVYENNSILGEKILFSIAAPYVTVGGKTNGGVVSFVSATMRQFINGQKYWEYSNKITLGTGSASNNLFGTGISMISCSSGYQVFMGELFGDTTSTNFGNIWVTTSSNGITWSTPISIVSGSITNSKIGLNNLKAVNFTKNGVSRSYLFFTEPKSLVDISNSNNTVTGKFFVVSSSANNNWGTTNINSQRTELYVSQPSTTMSGTLFDETDNRYSIEAYAGKDSLTYCFVNGIEDTEEAFSEIMIGSTSDGINWQIGDEMFRQINTNTRGCDLVAMSTYERDENTLPVFFTNLSSSAGINSIYAIHNNQYTQFTLNVSGVEKYVKQAALEPIMAPGILYNTIKSGIAVDWPCITGSQTSIIPYGTGTIVNSYYPQSFKIFQHSGNNIDELNIYGNLRSNIDYRVDFEKIIFPDNIFLSKTLLTSSLTEITTLTSLPENSKLVNFISGCYIYGGYEPYTSPVDFSDFNQSGPKRFSIPFVYKKENSKDSGLYSLAMSNFLAETVKFFLKDQLLTTFQSKPDSEWGTFEIGKRYYMDVVLSKTANLVMMEAYHSDKHPIGANGEKMHGRYFGYPVNKTNKKLWSQQSDELFTEEESRLIHNDPAYAPYTPPYFEGEAVARMYFTATSGSHTLDQVFSGLVIENIFSGLESAHTASDAYINKMPVGSSLTLKGKLPSIIVSNNSNGEVVQTVDKTKNSWIISTKFETPVLDFSNQELVSYENDYIKTSGYGRGMWSGYGTIPEQNKGIIVKLKESPEGLIGTQKSLLQQVGFVQQEKRVGIIADSKMVKEGIMIIPFVEGRSLRRMYAQNNSTTQLERDLNIEFIGLNTATMNRVLNQPNIYANSNNSIYDNMQRAKEYIIPPQIDFINNRMLSPFVFYIAEFKHELKQQDLADIWQGVSPKIATEAELDSFSISHKNSEYEFYHGNGLPDNVRFMIFKVKQKGEFNYFNVTKDSTDDANFQFKQSIGRREATNLYSYNWPYDYFSLVELAKIDIKLEYVKSGSNQ